MNTHHQTNTIKNLVQEIENNGIYGLVHAATKLYKNEVRSRLNYGDFYERTHRATKPLINVDEAIYYSSTFAKEHLDRFNHVLNNLGATIMFAQKLAVIDYGCGQGLATLAFLNYLQQNNCIANKVIDVHLIEPSAITLALARQFVLAMAKHTQIQVNVSVHQQTLSEYLKNPIIGQSDVITLHFLSNILDIKAIQSSLIELSGYINQQQGQQYICAVSPSYNDDFRNFYQNLSHFSVDYKRFCVNSYRFNSNRCVWTHKQAYGQSLYAQKVA